MAAPLLRARYGYGDECGDEFWEKMRMLKRAYVFGGLCDEDEEAVDEAARSAVHVAVVRSAGP